MLEPPTSLQGSSRAPSQQLGRVGLSTSWKQSGAGASCWNGFGTHGWLWFCSTALPNCTQLSAGDAQIKEQLTASEAGEKSA